jgi:hypothetical protein
MSNFEMCSEFDESILQSVLEKEKYEWINSYEIKIKMFFKYGKYDKEGNLKTPALQKNGTAIPAQIKIVSAFNRMTDNVDVKIILNKEYWDELNTKEREGVIDNMLNYLEVKKDKMDEPIPISEDSDKVQLKLKKPDFYCEGFLSLIEDYGKAYIPYQDAEHIVNNLSNDSISIDNNTTKVINDNKSNIENKGNKNKKIKQVEKENDEINLDDFDVE